MSEASQEILFLLLLFCLTWRIVLQDSRAVNTVQVKKEEPKRRSVLGNLNILNWCKSLNNQVLRLRARDQFLIVHTSVTHFCTCIS